MRETLFRGKRTDNDRWIEGGLIPLDENYTLIVPPYEQASTLSVRNLILCSLEKVDPETVGQYINKLDVNGKKIFEGDIVKEMFLNDCYGKVVWYDDLGWCIECKGSRLYTQISKYSLEIVGNIYDNQEPLKENRNV